CTIDRHMVFSVPASLTDPPLSPSLLLTLGNTTCKPERVTSEYALFKIPMDGCGARRMVGKTMVHMVEVINKVHAINLNYGTITRDAPVLLVECRYLPSNVLTVNYMVKTPSLGPAIHTQGVFGVQLRIAKAQYSSYYPQYHQPLEMLLGKLLYLEVRLLNNPDPTLVLLVHFCVAYPRSGNAVWLLQTRRFAIRTFLFLSGGEIYFMCSTEICSPSEGLCVEGCF
uniref:ZP domain-containing protein n=1 Tax=Mola mola TaxID=94237 RepID=A0A3Q4B0K4_MOLML